VHWAVSLLACATTLYGDFSSMSIIVSESPDMPLYKYLYTYPHACFSVRVFFLYVYVVFDIVRGVVHISFSAVPLSDSKKAACSARKKKRLE
jgi:hypothetical protein